MADGPRYSLGIDLGSTPWSIAFAEADGAGYLIAAAAALAASGPVDVDDVDDAVVTSVHGEILAMTARRGAASAASVPSSCSWTSLTPSPSLSRVTTGSVPNSSSSRFGICALRSTSPYGRHR